MDNNHQSTSKNKRKLFFSSDPFSGRSTHRAKLHRKKGKRHPFIILFSVLIIAIILTVTVFGRTIMYSVSPEVYVGLLFKNTGESIITQLKSTEKSLFGFNPDLRNDFTTDISVDYTGKKEFHKADLSLSNVPGKTSFFIDGSYENSKGEGQVKGYLNNERIAAMIPGSDGMYMTVPSAHFGNSLKNSGGCAAKYLQNHKKWLYDAVTGIDLSYSSINREQKENNKSKLDFLRNNKFLDLLEKCTFGKKTETVYKFNSGEEKAQRIVLTASYEDIFNYLLSVYKDMDDSDMLYRELIKEALQKNSLKISNWYDMLCSAEKVEFELIEYDNKIVSLTYKTKTSSDIKKPANDIDVTAAIKATDTNNFLEGLQFTRWADTREEYIKKGSTVYDSYAEIVFNSDTSDKKLLFNLEGNSTSGTANYKSDYRISNTFSGSIFFDYEKGEWSASHKNDRTYTLNGKKIKGTKTDNNKTYVYEGECSKNEGFSLTLKHSPSSNATLKAALSFKETSTEMDIREKHENILVWKAKDFEAFAKRFKKDFFTKKK